MTDNHVLVTGGAGFIGSHLVDALLERGDRVTVLDRLSAAGASRTSRSTTAILGCGSSQGDVGDAVGRRPLVAGVDAVVHAAAETHVDRSIDDPGEFLDDQRARHRGPCSRPAGPTTRAC